VLEPAELRALVATRARELERELRPAGRAARAAAGAVSVDPPSL
jgi:hypothetical protein